MPKNYSKWSLEEENLLRTLKEEQNDKNQVNWETISELISEKFKTLKTPKQCRQRYINYLNFGENEALILTWSQEQLDRLVQLYLQHGSAWSTICQFFRNKSQNSIKNKFNNGIRKTCKILHECEVRITKKPKKNITSQLLLSMLDFVNQIQKLANSSNLSINMESNIFKFRRNLLKLSFGKQVFIEEDVCQLVKLIKTINFKLRSFGHFKAKNQRMWKITQKNIEAISRFDKIINQEFYCNNFKVNQAPSLETSQMIQDKEYIQKKNSIQQLPELDMDMQICFGRTHTLMDQISGILDYNQEHPQYREYYTFDIFE